MACRLQVGFEIEVAKAVTLSSPGQGSSPDLVSAYPGERVFLDIRVFLVVDEELFGGLGGGCLDGVLFFFLFGELEPVFKIPGIEGGRGIVLYMYNSCLVRAPGSSVLSRKALWRPIRR